MKQNHSIPKHTGLLMLSLLLLLPLTECSNSKPDKQQSLKVNNVQALKGKSIGIQLGTIGDSYASDYESDDAGTSINRYNKGNDAIQALKHDKLDAVIIDEEPAKAYIQANPELLILEEEFASEDYAICVSKIQPDHVFL